LGRQRWEAWLDEHRHPTGIARRPKNPCGPTQSCRGRAAIPVRYWLIARHAPIVLNVIVVVRRTYGRPQTIPSGRHASAVSATATAIASPFSARPSIIIVIVGAHCRSRRIPLRAHHRPVLRGRAADRAKHRRSCHGDHCCSVLHGVSPLAPTGHPHLGSQPKHEHLLTMQSQTIAHWRAQGQFPAAAVFLFRGASGRHCERQSD
jgi:hypothetical protein